MKVKRFLAPTMQQALRMVRDEMGADAVILSNRKVEGGVEIITALNYDEKSARKEVTRDEELPSGRVAALQAEKHFRLQDEMSRSRERVREVRQRQQPTHERERIEPDWQDDLDFMTPAAAPAPVMAPRLETPRPVEAAPKTPSESDALSEMRAEINALREMLRQMPTQVAPAAQTTQAVPPVVTRVAQTASPESTTASVSSANLMQQRLNERLLDLGLSSVLANRYAAQCHQTRLDDGWKNALRQLATDLQVDSEEWVDRGGIIALVGPTGSGKTTTIGKLAARAVLRHGADSLALVTTDRYRIAAHEQLFVFGRILKVPVHVVDEAHSLDSILDELDDKRLVLIDTAGLTPADSSWQEQARELQRSRHPIQAHLVISATSQPRVMKSTWHSYKVIGLAGCVMTKLDEALTLGEVLGFAVESGLKIAYVTDGQKIPDDLHKAAPVALVKRAVNQLRLLDEQRKAAIGA